MAVEQLVPPPAATQEESRDFVSLQEIVRTARRKLPPELWDHLSAGAGSETTLRRAISSGELEAWQPHDDGNLVLWRNSLIEWATRRPAGDRSEAARSSKSRSTKPAAHRPHRTVAAIQRPDPIRLADVG